MEVVTMAKTMLAAGFALLLLGTIGLSYATAELSSGMTEIPQHWWSTLATAPLVAGVLFLAIAWRRSQASAR
jgi:hypothetical protein